VQSALKVCDGSDLQGLIKAIANRLPEVTDRKIRNKWEQILIDAANGTLQTAVRNPNADGKEGYKSSEDGESLSPDIN
jgi:hypothetical protein